MYTSIILFIISLLGVTTMVGRKILLIRNGKELRIIHSHPFGSELQKIKNVTLKNGKKLAYILLYITIRFFLKTSNSIKNKSKYFLKKVRNKFIKNTDNMIDGITDKKEVSKYLKVISEYRHKIKQMKHRIKEEEGIE